MNSTNRQPGNLSALLSMDAAAGSQDALTEAWGITPGYWLWSIPIKILFVIDGRINLTSDQGRFGLGYVIDTLTAPFSWWVRFVVHIAKRDGDLAGTDLGSHELTYRNFRFTDAGFDVNSYDQIWFFGDNPSGDLDTDHDIPGGSPLDDAELKLVADWMDRGGGVFAAGDHSILGASMCSRIPRVRTMRKWKKTQRVPTKNGSARHQTLQPTLENIFQQEEDTLLQPLEIVYRRVTGPLPFLRPLVPHPLLCSTRGVIDRFPDHMHEGEVFADEDVQLDLPLDIPGYDRPEYPFAVPEVLLSGGGLSTQGEFRPRPRPHIIAFGRTTNNYFEEPEVSLSVAPGLGLPPFFSKRFGLVGVYDGDSVGLGRVVVDSTWHHWFSLNLFGIQASDALAFQKMQAYYRNVGMWLATPSQRASMLISGTWGVLSSSAPMAFGAAMGPWEVGERVLDVLGLTLSPCMVEVVVAPFVDQKVLALSAHQSELPESEPSWSGVPEAVLHRALVGGIGRALLDLVLDDQAKRARGQRPRFDREAIRRRAVEGVSRGHAILRKSIEDAATALSAVHTSLAATAVLQVIDVQIPVGVRRLRVLAETLQFPDPDDPALIGPHVVLTIRVRLDESVVASRTLDRVELPAFKAQGGIVNLSCDVGEVEVQTGEGLTIEVLVGSRPPGEANPDVVRFKETRRGDAAGWVGASIPARSQPWRLWYRLEETGPPTYRA